MSLRISPSTRRRRTRFESLEDRRLLATLGVDIRFLTDNGGVPGAELQTPVLRGETFWVDVRVQDVRDGQGPHPGVIALPLNLSWDPALFDFVNTANIPSQGISPLPAGNTLVTDSFPLQRAVDSFDAAAGAFDPAADPNTLLDFFNLRGVRGGALPNGGQGQAIGESTADVFSQLQFVALADAAAAPFTVNLDGSMSFADAAPLDDVAGLGNTTIVSALANTVAATLPIEGGSISGTKFDDTNGNGVRDAGEPGIANVTIQLTPVDPQGTVVSILTDASGTYQFTDLAAGSYAVSELTPTGTVLTVPTNNRYDVVLQQGDSVAEDQDFGNFATVSLGGNKFNDENGDGLANDGLGGIAGVTVRLNVDSDNDPTNDILVVTDANGDYQFDNVGPGTHTISEVVPSGFMQTFPASGQHVVTLISGQDQTDLDFGNQAVPAGSSISGFVYSDVDRDGVLDVGEAGLPGVTVQLFLAAATTPVATTTTDAAGGYAFQDLVAGSYRVVEIQPERFVDASISRGTVLPTGDVRGTTTGFNTFEGIALNGQESAVDYNFGEVLSAVTKRMFLSSTNVRQELCSNLDLTCRSIMGTEGDDQIVVEHLADNRLRVTVNSNTPVELSPQDAEVVLVEGLGGQDTVSVIGNQQDEDFTAAPSRVTLTAADQRVGVFGAEQISVSGGGGTDTAELRDSDGADQLTATGNSVVLNSPDNQRIEMVDIDTILAVSAIDSAEDQATIDAIDFVLRLSGDWQ